MLVSELAVLEVRTVREDASLAEAGTRLREADCGSLPVVDSDHRVVGILTDRDLSLALTSEDLPPSRMAVADAMTRNVTTCRPDQDVRDALLLMSDRGVRRLPVCTGDGLLLGILSIDDILTAEPPDLDDRMVLGALRHIARTYREKREARIIEEHPTV